MKKLSFVLLLFLLGISAQEKTNKPQDNSEKPSAETVEAPYKEFPVDKTKGMQLVSLEDQKNWKNSKRVALIVGVSAYPQGSGLSRLNFGASDSQKMASVLKDVGQFDEVVLLNDEVGSIDPKLSPKRENILKERDRLLLGKPRLFLFYFSGHGFELKGENVVTPIDTVMGKEKEEPKNTLNIGTEIIEHSKKQNISQVMVFLDACRETLREGRSGGGVAFQKFPDKITSAKGIGVFVGTSPGGYSYEDGTLGGGVFTHYIVKGISGEVQNRGGEYVTFNDLKSYVETEMAAYIKKKGKNEQAPYSKGDYTGDFLLAVGRPGAEIKLDAVQYRSKSGDRVDAKRIYDAKGRLLRISFHTISDDGFIYPSSLDGISQIVYRYNDGCYALTPLTQSSVIVKSDRTSPLPGGEGSFSGDCFEALQYDKQGNLEYRHALKYNPNRGWEIRRVYRDEPGTRKADRTLAETEEIQYQRLEFDFNGNPILNEYQGRYVANKTTGVPEERPLVDKEGIARIVQNFDLLSNKTLEEYYDSERKLKPNRLGIARTIFAYDSIGNPILKAYTNEKGRQAQDSFGISKISYAYEYSKNLFGILLEKIQFGKSEEELAEGSDGLSRYEYIYDENCLDLYSKTKQDAANFACVKEIYYRGKDNQFKGNDKKIAISKYSYDDRGRLIEENYFRKDETPMTIKDGITKIQYKYDNSCWTKIDDSQLKLKCREADTACKANEELAYTCVNEIRTFNSGGLPEADSDGIAVYKYRYDSGCLKYMANKKECLSVSETLNIQGKVVLYPRERTVYHYDESCFGKGKTPSECYTLKEYYGAGGKLKENSYGYARIITQYDEKGNKTLEEYYGADGKLKENNGYARTVSQYDEKGNQTLKEYYGSDGKLKENNGYARIVSQYDEKGNQTLDEYYGSDGKLKEIKGYARYVSQYDEKGNQTLDEYYGSDGKLKEIKGYARYVSQYDERGNQTLEEYYGADGNFKENRNGYVRHVKWYDEKGNLKQDEYYGLDGKLKEYEGYARLVIQYDKKGNQTLAEYYVADGKLKEYEGYARLVIQYDEKGNQTLKEYYGADGKLKEYEGYARYVSQYDEKGNQTLVEYYGADGKLKENRDGYARNIMQCKEKGMLTLDEYYGADGKLKESNYGYARFIRQYDEACIVKGNYSWNCYTLAEYYGSDGKLKENNGYARLVIQYDEKGNQTLKEYYGSDGKLKENNGYARLVIQYDEKGNQTLKEYYGSDGKLKENNGYARLVIQYDEKGNQTLKEYYGSDGKLKENNGYARYVSHYDEKGNQTLTEYYGAAGILKENNGYARLVIQYDEKGNKTLAEYYGANGKLKEYEGYARLVIQYDKKGNQTLAEYYGSDGELKEGKGYARTVRQYNQACIAKGNKPEDCYTLAEYYGADGKLKENNGYARLVIQYDEKGNQTLKEYYGADGKLKENNGYARYVSQYDEKGNQTLEEYYGIDGKLIEDGYNGYARAVRQYNEKGMETLKEYYGSDGRLKKRKYHYPRTITQYNETCLSKSKEFIEKNQYCISYQEQYNENEVLTTVYKNIFNSSGEFIEQITLTDLIGTKKWSHTNNQFRFEEKIEQIKEKRTVKKEDKFLEEEVSFPVLNKSSYHLEFPNPKGGTGKQKVIVELDKLYRPLGVSFE